MDAFVTRTPRQRANAPAPDHDAGAGQGQAGAKDKAEAGAGTKAVPGKIRVGRRVYGRTGKFTDPKVPGFTQILCLTPSSAYGAISPYCLRDARGRNMENLWQFSKVYRSVPRSRQTSSRYDARVIWEHPAEEHVGNNGELLPAYWAWREKGFAAPDAIRYPVTFDYRSQCIGAIPPDAVSRANAGAVADPVVADAGRTANSEASADSTTPAPVAAGTRTLQHSLLDYVQSRRRIYLPLYTQLLQGNRLFEHLRGRHLSGENLLIIEVDGPHQESLKYYSHKYGVASDFIVADTVDVNARSMQVLLNDTTHPFGHGYCLAMALMGMAQEWNTGIES